MIGKNSLLTNQAMINPQNEWISIQVNTPHDITLDFELKNHIKQPINQEKLQQQIFQWFEQRNIREGYPQQLYETASRKKKQLIHLLNFKEVIINRKKNLNIKVL